MSQKCTATCRDGSPCNAWAVSGEEKCRMHLGKSPDGSSHEDNQNAQTHALFSSKDGYYQNLPQDEQEWVFDLTHTLLDRVRDRGDDPDMFDREALKNIAIDLHRISHANSYLSDEGLTQLESFVEDGVQMQREKVNIWAGELRQYNESVYRRMQKHGLLDDPESQKADAQENLAQAWVSGLTDD